jgi:hypothetical protein
MSTKFRLVQPSERLDVARRFESTPEERAVIDANKIVWQHAVEEYEDAEVEKTLRARENAAREVVAVAERNVQAERAASAENDRLFMEKMTVRDAPLGRSKGSNYRQ